MSQKRSVPLTIKGILDTDEKLSSALCNIISRFLPTRRFSTYYKGLEYSCHGLLWFAGWLAFIWCAWSQHLFQMQVNLFIGLLIDIFAVAIIKAYFRRRRPVNIKNQQWITIGPDVYSFPSGHVSRAFFIMFYFLKLYPLNEVMILLISIWAIAVSFSRILLRRHYLLDVIAGSILGYSVSLVMSIIWIDQDTAENIIFYLSDDKVEGGEYHV